VPGMQGWLIGTTDDPDRPALELSAMVAPEPGPDEIRVQVSAVGVNRADLLQVRGKYPPPAGYDPRVPGLEYSGVIDAVGERVPERSVGEAVMGLVPAGAYAEQLVTTEREAIPVPSGLSLAQAAAVPEAFLTAYRALVIEGGLAGGDTLLVRPVTAGVGLAAARLAQVLGARVIGVSRSVERLDQAQGLGIELDGSVLDTDDGVSDSVRELTGGVDVALDMVAGAKLDDTLACLHTEGRAVMIGLMGGMKAELDLGSLLMRRAGLKAMTMRAQPLEERTRHAQIFRHRLTPLFAAGALKPDLARTFPFDEAPAALEAMKRNEHLGRMVLKL
jgi:NADPH2:quinone reductase